MTNSISEMTTFLCAQVRAGVPIALAVESVGISAATYHRWMKAGDPDGDGPAEAKVFRRAIHEARRGKVFTHMTHIAVAAEKDWHAAAWILERTEKDDYSSHSRVDTTVIDATDGKARIDEILARLRGG